MEQELRQRLWAYTWSIIQVLIICTAVSRRILLRDYCMLAGEGSSHCSCGLLAGQCRGPPGARKPRRTCAAGRGMGRSRLYRPTGPSACCGCSWL